jgi:hypothetical protein
LSFKTVQSGEGQSSWRRRRRREKTHLFLISLVLSGC